MKFPFSHFLLSFIRRLPQANYKRKAFTIQKRNGVGIMSLTLSFFFEVLGNLVCQG